MDMEPDGAASSNRRSELQLLHKRLREVVEGREQESDRSSKVDLVQALHAKPEP